MNRNLLKLALTITLLANNLYAGNTVSQSKNGITVSVRSLSSQECKKTFGKDLHSNRIYPICFSIHNEKKAPAHVSVKSIQVLEADILTANSINVSIGKWSLGTLFLTIVFFPFGLLSMYYVDYLKELLPIVEKWSMTDKTSVIIPSGEPFEAFVFPEFKSPETEYPKDKNGNRLRDENGKELPGKTPPFIAPEFVDATVTFATDTAWFRFTLEFSVPV